MRQPAGRRGCAMSDPGTGQLTEGRVRELMEDYGVVYERRDTEAFLEFFADDAVMVLAPGTFRGREGVRQVLGWDSRITPTVRLRPLGVDLLLKGNAAVREVVFEATCEGIDYEYPNPALFEFDANGKIRRYRSSTPSSPKGRRASQAGRGPTPNAGEVETRLRRDCRGRSRRAVRCSCRTGWSEDGITDDLAFGEDGPGASRRPRAPAADRRGPDATEARCPRGWRACVGRVARSRPP